MIYMVHASKSALAEEIVDTEPHGLEQLFCVSLRNQKMLQVGRASVTASAAGPCPTDPKLSSRKDGTAPRAKDP